MSRYVGVCLYGMNNPHPEKKIQSIRFKSAGDSTKWMVLGVTLSEQPVFFLPDMVSAGIPDNWGAAAVVYALVEGLCGVKDTGVAFNHTLLSPRWPAAGEKEAQVTIKYPASGGYVSYRYLLEGATLKLEYTGSLEQSELELLLPEGKGVTGVKINNRTTEFELRETASSRYLVVHSIPTVVNRVEITLA